MRTTVTLDEDVAARLHHLTRERRISFKEAINETLRAGLAGDRPSREYRLPTYPLSVRAGIDLDRALQLDAALEDEETLRKLALRK
jgi:hypothetical protein